ncbi:hypothetical protein RSSL_00310 [Streptococcus salivarius K12]|uniref:Uncharacterized protein n=1 Tax=Streptococcus salivarius K12 TaxID=1200793 RepID=J7T681_STRSL|nr:hypothetical protein RSSL_00310 [Streptococcus salivarius K12]
MLSLIEIAKYPTTKPMSAKTTKIIMFIMSLPQLF